MYEHLYKHIYIHYYNSILHTPLPIYNHIIILLCMTPSKLDYARQTHFTEAHLSLFSAVNELMDYHGVFMDEPIATADKVYWADIFILPHKLVIEVDGATHLKYNQEVKDMARDKALLALGYKTLRFQDTELNSKKKMKAAIEKIKSCF